MAPSLRMRLRNEMFFHPLEEGNRLAMFAPLVQGGGIVVACDNGQLPASEFLPDVVSRLSDGKGNFRFPGGVQPDEPPELAEPGYEHFQREHGSDDRRYCRDHADGAVRAGVPVLMLRGRVAGTALPARGLCLVAVPPGGTAATIQAKNITAAGPRGVARRPPAFVRVRRRQALKELPQPHVVRTFGLLNLKPDASRVST